MLILRGKLRAVLDVPASTNKKTGEVYGAHTTLQIESVSKARGVDKIELHNITVADAAKFRPMVDKPVEVPVRAYAPGQAVKLIEAD
jgi:hypothetical protein